MIFPVSSRIASVVVQPSFLVSVGIPLCMYSELSNSRGVRGVFDGRKWRLLVGIGK